MNYSCTTQNGTCVDDDLNLNNSKTQFIIYIGIRVAQVTVGIIGNFMTLIIISQLKQRVNGHIIMVYLAVSDILVCCMLPMSYLRNSSIINEKHWKNFCVISEYLYNLSMSYSVVSYITASIDRYVGHVDNLLFSRKFANSPEHSYANIANFVLIVPLKMKQSNYVFMNHNSAFKHLISHFLNLWDVIIFENCVRL